jgi:hypothetical protein
MGLDQCELVLSVTVRKKSRLIHKYSVLYLASKVVVVEKKFEQEPLSTNMSQYLFLPYKVIVLRKTYVFGITDKESVLLLVKTH